MLTITLDEQGDFENIQNKLEKEPVFIGGIIYDDMGIAGEKINEIKRLKSYYKKVCSSVGTKFPKDLHRNGNNSIQEAKTKAKVSETLKEFFEKGTFEDADLFHEKRKGQYYIYCLLRNDGGKRELLNESVSKLAKDNYAANLYLHMAEDVVERVIFHNPVITNIDKVNVDLATRRVLVKQNDEELNRRFKTLGIYICEDPNHNNGDKNEYVLTNPYMYRTALEREMLSTGKTDIEVEWLSSRSIVYSGETYNQMEFLYLADSICSYLSFKIGEDTKNEWINLIEERVINLNPGVTNLLFTYDKTDEVYKKAYTEFEQKKYYEALSYAYDLTKLNGSAVKYYVNTWIKKLISDIKKENEWEAVVEAVHKLYEATQKTNVHTDKLLYVYQHLVDLAEDEKHKEEKNLECFYDLYDAGVSTFTHIGDSKRSRECYEKCESYAFYIRMERFIATRNKRSTFLNDTFHFEEALEIAETNIIYQKVLNDMKEEIFGEKFKESLHYAKCLSQKGQVLAFLRDPSAKEVFLTALEIMKDDPGNQLITMSYLLHFFLDQGEKESYDNMAIDYFGGYNTLKEQLDYLVREGKSKSGKIALRFGLYVFIRGIYLFHLDEVNIALYRKLKNVLSTENLLLCNHPTEITYKYMAFIALYRNDLEYAKECAEKIETSIPNSGATIGVIIAYGKYECYKKFKEKDFEKSALKKLIIAMRKVDEEYQELDDETILSIIRNKMTFMYV